MHLFMKAYGQFLLKNLPRKKRQPKPRRQLEPTKKPFRKEKPSQALRLLAGRRSTATVKRLIKSRTALSALRYIYERTHRDGDFEQFAWAHRDAIKKDLETIYDYVDDYGYFSVPARLIFFLKCFKG